MNTRRYETDYAGAWKGKCITRENAIIAAMKHIVRDGYTACTITDLHTGKVVARLHISEDKKSAHIATITQMRKV